MEEKDIKGYIYYYIMNIPFVEKYRPVNFEEIVLDPLNKEIMFNIIETGYFPNLLFFNKIFSLE